MANTKSLFLLYITASTMHLLAEPFQFTDYGTWIAPNSPLLPAADYSFAICAYNNTIVLLGGAIHKNTFTEFDISTQTMTNASLPNSTFGFSQHYVQIDNLCHFIDPLGQTIFVYDLQTTQLSQILSPFETDVDKNGCLASAADNTLLFVVGGWNNIDGTLNTLQIYNKLLNIWFYGRPMLQSRRSFSCIVHPVCNALYAIGGYHDETRTYLDQVEKILIDNITNNQWIPVAPLNEQRCCLRTVIYKDAIFVVGGYNGTHFMTDVIAINCNNAQVSSAANLNYSVHHSGVILVNATIYAFGGQQYLVNETISVKTWQYLNLQLATTSNPTTSNAPTQCGDAGDVMLQISFDYILTNELSSRDAVIDTLSNAAGIFIETVIDDSVNCHVRKYFLSIKLDDNLNNANINASICLECINGNTLIINFMQNDLEERFIETVDDTTNVLTVTAVNELEVEVIQVNDSEITTTEIENDGINNKNKELLTDNSLIIIIMAIGILCLIVVFLCCLYKSVKKHRIDSQIQSINVKNIQCISEEDEAMDDTQKITNEGDPTDVNEIEVENSVDDIIGTVQETIGKMLDIDVENDMIIEAKKTANATQFI